MPVKIRNRQDASDCKHRGRVLHTLRQALKAGSL